MYAPRPKAGFTLLELMIVITVVGIAMAAAAPAFGAAFADHRTVSAVRDVIRIGRRAYWEATRFHRAHVVRFTSMGGPGAPGRVELIRGDTNSCTAPSGATGAPGWPGLRALGTRCADLNSRCIDWVDLSDDSYQGFSGTGPLLTLADADGVTPTAVTDRALCFRPDGSMSISANLATAFTRLPANSQNTVNGGLIFLIQAYDNDDTQYEGVQRRVLFPMGAPARSIR